MVDFLTNVKIFPMMELKRKFSFDSKNPEIFRLRRIKIEENKKNLSRKRSKSGEGVKIAPEGGEKIGGIFDQKSTMGEKPNKKH